MQRVGRMSDRRESHVHELVRELTHLLLSASRASARVRRCATSDGELGLALAALDEAVGESIRVARAIVDEVARSAAATVQPAGDARAPDSMRIELRGVTPELGARVSRAIRCIAEALDGQIEVEPDPGRAGAVVVRIRS
jgi:hypothetical protein